MTENFGDGQLFPLSAVSTCNSCKNLKGEFLENYWSLLSGFVVIFFSLVTCKNIPPPSNHNAPFSLVVNRSRDSGCHDNQCIKNKCLQDTISKTEKIFQSLAVSIAGFIAIYKTVYVRKPL